MDLVATIEERLLWHRQTALHAIWGLVSQLMAMLSGGARMGTLDVVSCFCCRIFGWLYEYAV